MALRAKYTGATLVFYDDAVGIASPILTIDKDSAVTLAALVGLSVAELGVLDGVTPGTSAASKAVVLGADSKISALDITALKLGGTSLGSSAASIDAVVAAAVAGFITPLSTVGVAAGGSPTQAVTITLKDAAGAIIAAVQKFRAYMCTDSAGATPSATGANTSVAATKGVILKEITAKLQWDVITAADGIATLVFNNTSGGGAYTDRLALVLPNGKLVIGAALNTATA